MVVDRVLMGVEVKGSGKGDGAAKTLKEAKEPKFHGKENKWMDIGEASDAEMQLAALSVKVIITWYQLDEMMEPMMQSVVVTEPRKSQCRRWTKLVEQMESMK